MKGISPMVKLHKRLFLLALAGVLSSFCLTGCVGSLDDLTDKAINAVGTRVSDAMEDVDVKEVLGNISGKIGNALSSMPETSSAIKDTVSSLTSSFLSDVSSESASAPPEESASPSGDTETGETVSAQITETGKYTGKDEVAAFIHSFGRLPDNYLTSEQAKSLGWDGESDLWAIQSGAALGGDDYANLAGLLPSDGGRSWKQCDVNYNGGMRGPERLCYSSDGLIYYSPDRFTTFTELIF